MQSLYCQCLPAIFFPAFSSYDFFFCRRGTCGVKTAQPPDPYLNYRASLKHLGANDGSKKSVMIPCNEPQASIPTILHFRRSIPPTPFLTVPHAIKNILYRPETGKNKIAQIGPKVAQKCGKRCTEALREAPAPPSDHKQFKNDLQRLLNSRIWGEFASFASWQRQQRRRPWM